MPQDTCRLFAFALGLQLCMFLIATAPHIANRVHPTSSFLLRLVETVEAAVPIAAPAMFICALAACGAKLRVQGIYLLVPMKMKQVADMSIACFDKTGTLTGSVVRSQLHGNDMATCVSCVQAKELSSSPCCDRTQ